MQHLERKLQSWKWAQDGNPSHCVCPLVRPQPHSGLSPWPHCPALVPLATHPVKFIWPKAVAKRKPQMRGTACPGGNLGPVAGKAGSCMLLPAGAQGLPCCSGMVRPHTAQHLQAGRAGLRRGQALPRTRPWESESRPLRLLEEDRSRGTRPSAFLSCWGWGHWQSHPQASR